MCWTLSITLLKKYGRHNKCKAQIHYFKKSISLVRKVMIIKKLDFFIYNTPFYLLPMCSSLANIWSSGRHHQELG